MMHYDDWNWNIWLKEAPSIRRGPSGGRRMRHTVCQKGRCVSEIWRKAKKRSEREREGIWLSSARDFLLLPHHRLFISGARRARRRAHIHVNIVSGKPSYIAIPLVCIPLQLLSLYYTYLYKRAHQPKQSKLANCWQRAQPAAPAGRGLCA